MRIIKFVALSFVVMGALSATSVAQPYYNMLRIVKKIETTHSNCGLQVESQECSEEPYCFWQDEECQFDKEKLVTDILLSSSLGRITLSLQSYITLQGFVRN